MRDDNAVQVEGMAALIKSLGILDAGRFIMLTKLDKFDYTEWKSNQPEEDLTAEEIFNRAAAFRAQMDKAEAAKNNEAQEIVEPQPTNAT